MHNRFKFQITVKIVKWKGPVMKEVFTNYLIYFDLVLSRNLIHKFQIGKLKKHTDEK